MRFAHFLAVLLGLLAILLGGCGGNGGSKSSTASGSTNGTGDGILVKADIGGVVSSGNKAVVVIPAHALAQDTRVTVAPATGTLPQPPANKVVLGGTAFDLTPNSLAFSTPASLTIRYNPASLPAGVPESSLQIYTVASGEWQLVTGSSVDAVNHTVSVPLAHFSVYAIVAPAFTGSGPIYDLVDLGVLPGDGSTRPLAISSDGRVTGLSVNASGELHAFLWSNGALTNLGRYQDNASAIGNDVNASGVAVGIALPADASNSFPVKFENGAVTLLPTPVNEGAGTAYAINDEGDFIVNRAISKGGVFTSFVGFDHSNFSGGLNEVGDVAGTESTHAAIWRSGTVIDAGVLPGYDASSGAAISDDGKLAGTANVFGDENQAGFLWENGAMTKISPVTGDNIVVVRGVNNAGQVVGTSTQGFIGVHGFVYQNGVTQDLNSLISHLSGWQILEAYGINNRGQIIVTAVNGGATHSLLLNPKS